MQKPTHDERREAFNIVREAEENEHLLDDPVFFARYTWAKWIIRRA
jgi:hypothetical protein